MANSVSGLNQAMRHSLSSESPDKQQMGTPLFQNLTLCLTHDLGLRPEAASVLPLTTRGLPSKKGVRHTPESGFQAGLSLVVARLMSRIYQGDT